MKKTGALRQRRYRQRQHNGEVVLAVAVPEHAIAELMIESGRLTEDEALDRHLVEQAAAAVLVELARRWLRESGHR